MCDFTYTSSSLLFSASIPFTPFVVDERYIREREKNRHYVPGTQTLVASVLSAAVNFITIVMFFFFITSKPPGRRCTDGFVNEIL